MLIPLNLQTDNTIERRAALDIGSGQIKVFVADVDTETNRIVKNIFSKGIKVPFSDDLTQSIDKTFSLSIQLQAKETIAELMRQANQYQPEKFFGIATEAFRLAENGAFFAKEVSRELNTPIRVVSQFCLFILGFLTAFEISTAVKNPKMKRQNWDF